MSILNDAFDKAYKNGGLDLRKLMESFSLHFDNLSLNDVRFIESKCQELRAKFEDAEKVDCFKTRGIQCLGFNETAYFSIEEIDLVKNLSQKLIEQGRFDFEIKRIKISKNILDGHIADRKEWERHE